MKPPTKTGPQGSTSRVGQTYAAPTPKVSRLKRGKVLTAAERAAFLASRPELKPKD